MRNRATLSPMNLTVRKPMTLAEFLAWEERQEQRYEFNGSEPVAGNKLWEFRRATFRHQRRSTPS